MAGRLMFNDIMPSRRQGNGIVLIASTRWVFW